jgi:hypothetical protein
VISAPEFFRELDAELSETIVGNVGFSENAQAAPVAIPRAMFTARIENLKVIQSLFVATLQIFRGVLKNEFPPIVGRLLFNDVALSYGADFHRSLPDEAWTIPAFFRTDESKSGKILEIQCPGSGWGELELLKRVYSKYYASSALKKYNPSLLFANEVVNFCSSASPSVLHLLDNSSNPISMRYLIATTQPPLRYWGYENSVRNSDCHFIRSHSFFGLVSENLFRRRLRALRDGTARFDLPPVLVFDQKAPLCLPFMDETRSLFSDSVRDLLAYSYPIQSNGFRDVDGSWVTIEEFVKRPPAQRRYYLKYAGCDVEINWGSRAVYRLRDGDISELMSKAVEDSKRDRFWLIQCESSEKDTVVYFERTEKSIVEAELTAKYSSFYGPSNLIGLRTMHRRHFKVHGQEDTVIGLAVPGLHEEGSVVSSDG